MSYSADVFRIMIASPGDLTEERKLARDVIHEWNDVHSATRKIVLLPVGWETHSSPEMGKTPQEIINARLLDKCDILVGLFWTRLGTPTTNYESGTVEEIEKHIGSGRPTMLYFSSQPAALKSVDIEQYKKLKEFKESCQKRGLYHDFDSSVDFRTSFGKQLQILLNEHNMFTSISSPDELSPIINPQANSLMSPSAQKLLKEASLDSSGTILFVKYMGGASLNTNGKDLLEPVSTARVVATWEAAVEELLELELIQDQGYKKEVFSVTARGYQVADLIELQT